MCDNRTPSNACEQTQQPVNLSLPAVTDGEKSAKSLFNLAMCHILSQSKLLMRGIAFMLLLSCSRTPPATLLAETRFFQKFKVNCYACFKRQRRISFPTVTLGRPRYKVPERQLVLRQKSCTDKPGNGVNHKGGQLTTTPGMSPVAPFFVEFRFLDHAFHLLHLRSDRTPESGPRFICQFADAR